MYSFAFHRAGRSVTLSPPAASLCLADECSNYNSNTTPYSSNINLTAGSPSSNLFVHPGTTQWFSKGTMLGAGDLRSLAFR
jgi:hypothetical protein